MLRKIRTILAAVFFVLITLLFLDFTGTLHHWLSWLAKIQFLPAVMALNVGVIVALVLLTLIFGRIYCSVICPLGVLQDVLARFQRKRNKYSYSHEVRWLRYPILVVFVRRHYKAPAVGKGSRCRPQMRGRTRPVSDSGANAPRGNNCTCYVFYESGRGHPAERLTDR